MQDSSFSTGISIAVKSAIGWLTVNRGSSDPEVIRRAKRIATVILLGLLGLSLGTITSVATGQSAFAVAPFLAALAFLACGVALRAGASNDVIANAVIGTIAVLIFGMLLATGGASIGAIIAIPLVPATAVVIGDRSARFSYSAIAIVVIATVVFLTVLGFDFPVQPDPSKVTIAKFFIAIVVVGMVYGIAQIWLDDQQRTEQALLESEQLFKQATRIAGLGHYTYDDIGDRFISVSDEYTDILGVTLDELLTRYNSSAQYRELIHPDDLEKIKVVHSEYSGCGKGHDIEYRIQRPDGEEIYVRDIEGPIIDRHGHFVQTVGILQDITKQKEALRRLEENEALLQQAVRTAKLGHWSFDDSNDTYLSVSPEYARIFGHTVEEFLERYTTLEQNMELVHPEDRERVAKAYEIHDHNELEYRIIRADGSIRSVIELERQVPDTPEYCERYDGTLQDITELRHIQERSRELKNTQRELAKNLSYARRAAQLVKLGTYVWDWTGERLETCSEEYALIHEMSVDEAIRTFSSFAAAYNYVHPDDRERVMTLEAAAIRDRVGYSSNYRMLLPSGHTCHVREVCEVELDDQGAVSRTLGSIQDVSGQVELEDQLRQSRKMEAVGHLTSGIAHDFNNILAVIMGNLELAIENTKENSIDREILADAMQGAQQGADLNKQLLAFSRQEVLAERVVNVNETIRSMSSLLERTLGEEIEVEMDCGEKNCFCDLDPALLESAILNLAINARDAMIGGGNLRIATRTGLSGRLSANAGVSEELIQISVSDSGTGMSTEVKEHALEPFFTTKDVGVGSGLGLSMVYGFVTQTGGRMEIESDLRTGTTIHMLLPSADGRDEMLGALNEHDMPIAVDGEVILVVEDQPEVRDVVVRQLGKLGYEVLEAEDGRNAVEILESRQTIDLILSDMVLPGSMGGEEIVSKAKAILPDIKALYMSGNPARSDNGNGKIQAPLIQKPFRQADLARAVRDRLDAR